MFLADLPQIRKFYRVNRLYLSYKLSILISEVKRMIVNTDYSIPMIDAKQNFSKVVREV